MIKEVLPEPGRALECRVGAHHAETSVFWSGEMLCEAHTREVARTIGDRRGRWKLRSPPTPRKQGAHEGRSWVSGFSDSASRCPARKQNIIPWVSVPRDPDTWDLLVVGVPGSPTSGFAHTAFTWNALLPSSPIPTYPSKCKRTSAGCHTDALPRLCPLSLWGCLSIRIPACWGPLPRTGTRLEGAGSPGKGVQMPLWQREGSDGRPPARAPYCHLQALLPFLRAHPLRSHRTRCTAPAGPLKQQTWIHLLTVLEAGRPRWSLFLLRPLSPGPHGISPPCGSEP